MAKLTRITGKLFGETATATGDNPQIGQFGSGLAGTYVGTTDVATIQNLTAWSNGFIGCVTPDTQYPPLPEMTGFGKVLSYQQNYLLQQGIAEWDNATTYYINSYVSYEGKIYISLTNNNLNHNPATSTTNWAIYGKNIYSNIDLSNLSPTGQAILDNKANIDLSNLSVAGNNRLHALKGYLDNGTALTDAEGLVDVINYAHSTFDASKFTQQGTPVITDGVLSKTAGESQATSNYVTFPFDPTASSWKIAGEFTIDTFATARILGDTSNSAIQLYLGSSGINLNVNNSGTSTNVIPPVAFPSGVKTGTFNVYIEYNNGTYSIGWKRDTSNTWQTGTGESAIVPDKSIVSILQMVSANGSISFDLKKLEYYKNGYLAFSGNKTAIDTYTIEGDTVTIPYTLSKTGSKIVSSVYRTQVTAVYNEYGYAPYYTLDEANGNFTLPQGEIYGMMLNQSTPHIVETYKNGTSWYRVWSDGWCEQGGMVYIQGDAGGGTVAFLKPYKDTNYQVLLTNATYFELLPAGVAPDSKLTTSVTFDYGDAQVTGDVYWETKGYIS